MASSLSKFRRNNENTTSAAAGKYGNRSKNLKANEKYAVPIETTQKEITPFGDNETWSDIISEEIYLAIPKYPKKRGVKLENILITEENSELNPFKKLENLKI